MYMFFGKRKKIVCSPQIYTHGQDRESKCQLRTQSLAHTHTVKVLLFGDVSMIEWGLGGEDYEGRCLAPDLIPVGRSCIELL